MCALKKYNYIFKKKIIQLQNKKMVWFSSIFKTNSLRDSDISFLENKIFEDKQSLLKMLIRQNNRIDELEKKYKHVLMDIKNLEEENIETTNELYKVMNQIEAVDNRIDILHSEYYNR